ncbi:MAG: fibronectin type III domain-containing protein, partial [Phycisphaerae bacterium]|nr:fibronectin type III domain-containing protein [Phycisphaerae bacterium]
MDDTEIDVKFSEPVNAAIKIENASGVVKSLYTSSSVTNPDPKTWDGTDGSGTTVADGTYHVNITMNDGVNPLVYNNTETITVLTSPDPDPPVITDVANGTPTADSGTITWTTDEASDSLVKYGTVSGTYTDSTPDTTMTTSHSIVLSGLSVGTTYYFVVNSTDASDNSAESTEHSFTTSSTADTTPPVITDVANSTPTTDSVTITWTTDENSGSLVKYGTVSGTYTDDAFDAAMITSHSIGLSGLTPDQAYYYVVNSTDASGNSAQSTEYSFTTAAYIPPSTTVSIEDVTVAIGESVVVPIMVNNVVNLGGCIIDMVYNASVVHV